MWTSSTTRIQGGQIRSDKVRIVGIFQGPANLTSTQQIFNNQILPVVEEKKHTLAIPVPTIQKNQRMTRTMISPRNVVRKRNSKRSNIATMLFLCQYYLFQRPILRKLTWKCTRTLWQSPWISILLHKTLKPAERVGRLIKKGVTHHKS